MWIKMVSARFWMSLIFTLTICNGFLSGMIQPDLFLPLATLVVGFYFNRNDRKQKGE